MGYKISKKIRSLTKVKTDLERWEDLSNEYIKYLKRFNGFVDTLRIKVLTPALMETINNVRGKRIIDAGCGEGYLCRALTREGADVVGIDACKTMIKEAISEEKSENLGIKYFLADMTSEIPLERASFDTVVANMVLFSVKDVESVIYNLSAYLKRGGGFVISILHPCFHLNYDHWDNMHKLNYESGVLNISMRESYKDERIIEKSYIDSINKIRVYLRPIEFYTDIFFKLGFIMTDFREPVLRLDDTKLNDRYYHAHLLPRFLITKFKKLG